MVHANWVPNASLVCSVPNAVGTWSEIRYMLTWLCLTKGNHMYAQIPPAKAEELEGVLEEGKVYVFKKFLCNQSPPAFRAVESPFMIQFTRFTVVDPMPGLEEGYPFCTYRLTPFLELPAPANTPARFIDVIGQIPSMSDIIPVQAIHQAEPSNTRTVILRDLLGNTLRLVLWGERALEFDAAAVRSVGEKIPVIGIFVGTLPKNIQGTRGLSGCAACRWYIDEDIADIIAFRKTLGEQFAPVAAYAPSEREALAIRTREPPAEKSVQELRDLDPFDNKGNQFLCTITVDALTSEQRWWFFSCEKCRSYNMYVMKIRKIKGSQYDYETLGLPQMSPPVEPPTPESALSTGSPPSAGTSKSVCPKRRTRVSLFAALPKEKDDAVETDPSDPTSTAMFPGDPTLDAFGTATDVLVAPSPASKTRKYCLLPEPILLNKTSSSLRSYHICIFDTFAYFPPQIVISSSQAIVAKAHHHLLKMLIPLVASTTIEYSNGLLP